MKIQRKKGNSKVTLILLYVCVSIACIYSLIVSRNSAGAILGLGKSSSSADHDSLSKYDGNDGNESKSAVTNSADKNGPKTKVWDDWPAVAYEAVGYPLVFKGDNIFNHARHLFFTKNEKGTSLMDEFLQVYKDRPDKTNLCGIRINHALALYLGVKQIQPTLVVESGVNAGQSTYFIRAASPTTAIYAMDPLDKPICAQGKRWMDKSDKTTYYTGADFVDLLKLDWKSKIAKGEVDPQKTLVFLDDHLTSIKRIAHLTKIGIRHVIVEDNYKINEGMYICTCT